MKMRWPQTRQSDGDRVLAEVAARDAYVHAARHVGGESAVQGRAELLDALDPVTLAAEGLDHLVITRVLEPRRHGAFLTVDLDLAASDLRPRRVIADHGDNRALV